MDGNWTAKSSGRRYWLVYDRTGNNTTKIEVARKEEAFATAEMFNRYEKNYDSLIETCDKLKEQLKEARSGR